MNKKYKSINRGPAATKGHLTSLGLATGQRKHKYNIKRPYVV